MYLIYVKTMPYNKVQGHNMKCSASSSRIDNCSDLNSELQRVLTGLESVLCGRKKSTCSLSVAEVDRHIEQLTTASEHCDLAIKVQKKVLACLSVFDVHQLVCDDSECSVLSV